ncbi:MAG: NAD(P)-dependent oxidoreductase [Acidobacteriota bacterium]|nr:NAD(P)-dependent oxidoreductase [Acidobacteriota bacterium]
MDPVLIVGTGHIGTFAARAVTERGLGVIACDLRPSVGFFLRFGPPGAEVPLVVDALDEDELSHTIRAMEARSVVVCAGANGGAARQPTSADLRINALLPAAVARAAIAGGAGRLILVSSRAAYGPKEHAPLTETDAVRPPTPYGRSKLAGEIALREASSGSDLDVCILRASGSFGPVRYLKGSHSARLFDDLLVAARLGRAIRLEASADTVDEYLYVKDLAAAIARAVSCGAGRLPRVVNIGPGAVTDAETLAATFEAVTGGWRPTLSSAGGSRRSAIQPLSITLAKASLGFSPRFDLEAGLRDYVREIGWSRTRARASRATR